MVCTGIIFCVWGNSAVKSPETDTFNSKTSVPTVAENYLCEAWGYKKGWLFFTLINRGLRFSLKSCLKAYTECKGGLIA